MIDKYRYIVSVSLQKRLKDSIELKPEYSSIKSYLKKCIKKKTILGYYTCNEQSFFWINGQYAYGLLFNHSKTDIKTLFWYYNRISLLFEKKKLLFDKPDTLIHAYVLLLLYCDYKKKAYLNLIELGRNFIKNEYYNNGLVRYRSNTNKFFIDTLGMICGFCYEYGRRFEDYEMNEIADKQLDYVLRRCEENDLPVPYHVYDTESNKPSGVYSWGRGIGWFLLGLTEGAINNPKKYKAQYNKTIEYVFLHQNKDGYFYDDFEKKNHIDTSITSMAALSLARGLQFGLIYKEMKEKKEKELILSVKALINSITENGQVMDSSGECCGEGRYSLEFGNFFAQGYTLALLNVLPHVIDIDEINAINLTKAGEK